MLLLILGLAMLVIAGGLFWNGTRTQRKADVLDRAVPTSADGVRRSFPGELVSLFGTARSEQELISQHQSVPCIYYKSSVIREYQRHRTNRHGPTRRKETVQSSTRSVPFYLEDETGRVRVIPEGAEFDALETMNEYVPESSREGVFSIAGVSVTVGNREQTLGHRYVENTIEVDKPVFVMGVVDEDGNISRPGDGRENAGFFISYRSQEGLKTHWETSAQRQAYGAIILTGIGIISAGYWLIENGSF